MYHWPIYLSRKMEHLMLTNTKVQPVICWKVYFACHVKDNQSAFFLPNTLGHGSLNETYANSWSSHFSGETMRQLTPHQVSLFIYLFIYFLLFFFLLTTKDIFITKPGWKGKARKQMRDAREEIEKTNLYTVDVFPCHVLWWPQHPIKDAITHTQTPKKTDSLKLFI